MTRLVVAECIPTHRYRDEWCASIALKRHGAVIAEIYGPDEATARVRAEFVAKQLESFTDPRPQPRSKTTREKTCEPN